MSQGEKCDRHSVYFQKGVGCHWCVVERVEGSCNFAASSAVGLARKLGEATARSEKAEATAAELRAKLARSQRNLRLVRGARDEWSTATEEAERENVELRAKLAAGIEYLEKLQLCADSYETVNGCILAMEHLTGEYISGLVAPRDPQPGAPDAAGLFHDRVHKDAGRSRVAKVAPRRPASKPLSHKMIHERTNSADEIRANIRKPPAPVRITVNQMEAADVEADHWREAVHEGTRDLEYGKPEPVKPEPPSEIKAPPMSDELLSDLGFGEPEPPSAGAVDTLDDIVNLWLSGVAIGGKVMPALRSDIDECLAYLRTVCKPDPA